MSEIISNPKNFTNLVVYATSVWMIAYFFVYMIFFLLSFNYYADLNRGILAKLQSQNITGIPTIINTYPWNLTYIYAFFFIWVTFISGLSYAIARLLEEAYIPFIRHLKVTLLASISAFIPMIVLIPYHSIFATFENSNLLTLSFSLAFWIFILLVSLITSSRVFSRLNLLFGLVGKRSTVVWVLSYILIFYFFVGLVRN
ncbi:hypothetical protein EHQ47_19505 [Leptospira bourretii]|uniref:hypothetical protein n=1 Tax=Leptospira bourretii TaxID=2484962 RepID=UPI0010915F28|nr:hypothetical protein [Leptospira bourretii]TGL17383.1 hypothetical protein EHQ47_19505 [Leptospira bourretii]